MKKTPYVCIFLIFVALNGRAENISYLVAENDTLWSISQKYKVSVQALKEANKIDDEKTLRIGMRLVIPQLYVVQKGDSLWGIAREYGTSVDVIKQLNTMASDHIRAGDVLVLPEKETRIIVDEATNETTAAAGPSKETPVREVSAVTEAPGVRAASGAPERPGETPFWPLDGARTRKTGKISGTEIHGSRGDSVISIASGEVVWNSTSSVFGNVVIIESSSRYLYLYSGLSNTAVRFGEKIKAGTKIAELGVNPHTGEAKLLFSVYRDGKLVDPSVAPRG